MSASTEIPTAGAVNTPGVMTSKQRMLAAITGTGPDRLPVTTHHVMPYFLDECLDGM